MKQNVCSLYYKEVSGSSWTSMGMVPGTGTLFIGTSDSKNGTIRTYRLNARISKDHPAGPTWLSGDLLIKADLDSGTSVQIGTVEMPVRLDVPGGDPLDISCSWQDAI